jgi:Flp pilus assembly protein TadG
MKRHSRHEQGQAIVLIAIMLAVLVGMAALAIDGSRAYALRRDLQSALDAAVLAAGDNFQQNGSYSGAEQAAATIFGTNLRLYTAPSCSPGYGTPGALPWTAVCTYSDGTVLTEVVSALGPQGSLFSMTATHSLQIQFARVLTNGAVPTIGASGTSAVGNLLYSPALTALDSAGCGGVAGNAITVANGGSVTILGDVVSNGRITGPGGLNVAGDVYARCQAAVAGVTSRCYPSTAPTPCTYPDVAGATRAGYHVYDPTYPLPTVAGAGQAAPGSTVVLKPGLYSANPNFGSGLCYFLSAGVYDWSAGYTNNGAFVSNELRPPDESESGDDGDFANGQLWNTDNANCAGAFQVTATSGSAIAAGTWAVEVTSTRSDTYSGTSYRRESAPSICRTVTIGAGQVMTVTVSNVPGASGYNVYVAPPLNGCNGPFGYAGSIQVAGSVLNNSTGSCPAFTGSSCSLGHESKVFDASVLGAGFVPGIAGAAYPPSDAAPPLGSNTVNQSPSRGVPPAGDRADENQCDTVGATPTTCPGAVTPGAVTLYIPSGGCLNATKQSDNFVFSGYQYDWLVVYEPGAAHPPANTCANLLGAKSDSAFIGLIYVPSASITVNKSATFRSEGSGGIMADTITFTGQPPTILFDPDYAPVPPASRLVG